MVSRVRSGVCLGATEFSIFGWRSAQLLQLLTHNANIVKTKKAAFLFLATFFSLSASHMSPVRHGRTHAEAWADHKGCSWQLVFAKYLRDSRLHPGLTPAFSICAIRRRFGVLRPGVAEHLYTGNLYPTYSHITGTFVLVALYSPFCMSLFSSTGRNCCL